MELPAQSGGDFTSLRCMASIRRIVTDKIYPDFIKVIKVLKVLPARMARASRAAMRKSATPQ